MVFKSFLRVQKTLIEKLSNTESQYCLTTDGVQIQGRRYFSLILKELTTKKSYLLALLRIKKRATT